ncbi:MAG: porin, partial [Proteobacteria bacterium]|nr:porin [Pseudomonadota bacterium]
MNKLLLGTTALVGASILMAGAAYAAKPKVTVKAYVKFEVLGSSQDLEAITGKKPNRGYGFATDSEVTVEVDGVTDAGMKVKAHIEMETDAGSSGNDETWIRFSGSWGQINLGSEDGAEDLMQHGTQKAHTAGDGGVDGDWVDAIDWTSVNGRLVAGAKLAQDSSDAVKATYFTPRVGGLQLGVSFTPDKGTSGRKVGPDNDGSFESSWGIGVNFVKKIGGANVAISAVGHIAEAEAKKSVADPTTTTCAT